MDTKIDSLIFTAVDAVGGYSAAARLLGVHYTAPRRWVQMGRLPKTELTGETGYAGPLARVAAEYGAPIEEKDLLEEIRDVIGRQDD